MPIVIFEITPVADIDGPIGLKEYVCPATKFDIDAVEGAVHVAGKIDIAGIEGTELTVTVVVIEHPLELVYVIKVEPAEIAVTRPVFETVAIEAFELTHGLTDAGVPGPAN